MSYREYMATAHGWNAWRRATSYAEIRFDGEDFSGKDFSGFDFQFVEFKQCSFQGAILHDTNFRLSKLTDCDLRDCKFWKTLLEKVDVSTCRFGDIPTNCFVEGTIVSRRQMALILAQTRKFVVKD